MLYYNYTLRSPKCDWAGTISERCSSRGRGKPSNSDVFGESFELHMLRISLVQVFYGAPDNIGEGQK